MVSWVCIILVTAWDLSIVFTFLTIAAVIPVTPENSAVIMGRIEADILMQWSDFCFTVFRQVLKAITSNRDSKQYSQCSILIYLYFSMIHSVHSYNVKLHLRQHKRIKSSRDF